MNKTPAQLRRLASKKTQPTRETVTDAHRALVGRRISARLFPGTAMECLIHGVVESVDVGHLTGFVMCEVRKEGTPGRPMVLFPVRPCEVIGVSCDSNLEDRLLAGIR